MTNGRTLLTKHMSQHQKPILTCYIVTGVILQEKDDDPYLIITYCKIIRNLRINKFCLPPYATKIIGIAVYSQCYSTCMHRKGVELEGAYMPVTVSSFFFLTWVCNLCTAFIVHIMLLMTSHFTPLTTHISMIWYIREYHSTVLVFHEEYCFCSVKSKQYTMISASHLNHEPNTHSF
jgi:hypothetical protein